MTFDREPYPPMKNSGLEDAVVEYEPDTDLRDTEQVPLLEEGGSRLSWSARCYRTPKTPDTSRTR